MRIYLPATWPMLARTVKTGNFEPLGGTAFALTPKLRESYTAGDDEELEYAAMNEAARASLRLLSVEFGLGEDDTPARRVVVSADTDTTPMDTGAIASRTTYVTGNAILLAAKKAKMILFDTAAPMLGVKPEQLEARDL